LANNEDIARSLLNRALVDVPEKNVAHVLLECSRLEEFQGFYERSRKLLARARRESRQEWKIFLESVLVECRSGYIKEAIAEAHLALKIHTGTGRLWAVFIQLVYSDGNLEDATHERASSEYDAVDGDSIQDEIKAEPVRSHALPTSPFQATLGVMGQLKVCLILL
jgi:hypothetical protein